MKDKHSSITDAWAADWRKFERRSGKGVDEETLAILTRIADSIRERKESLEEWAEECRREKARACQPDNVIQFPGKRGATDAN